MASSVLSNQRLSVIHKQIKDPKEIGHLSHSKFQTTQSTSPRTSLNSPRSPYSYIKNMLLGFRNSTTTLMLYRLARLGTHFIAEGLVFIPMAAHKGLRSTSRENFDSIVGINKWLNVRLIVRSSNIQVIDIPGRPSPHIQGLLLYMHGASR